MGSGLEGVIAAETVLSDVDGERGMILLRGRSLEDVVRHEGYEGAVALLWEGFAGEGLSRDGIAAELAAGREEAFAGLDGWLGSAGGRSLMEATRMCLAALPDDSAPAAIVGALAVGVPALLRCRRGETPLRPDRNLGTAADFLRMLHGGPVPDAHAAALETYCVAVMENGLNASTFTARVVASTDASLVSAALGAWSTFTGPKHGGAPGPTLDMLDEIAASGDAAGWIERRLDSGKRLMGFGHRMFRTRDPRADLLREALERIGSDAGRLAFAAEVERVAVAALERRKPGRGLRMNMEINAALLLDAVGVPRDAFTPAFALARIPAWIAHALEQKKTGRMIRPASAYVGPKP